MYSFYWGTSKVGANISTLRTRRGSVVRYYFKGFWNLSDEKHLKGSHIVPDLFRILAGIPEP